MSERRTTTKDIGLLRQLYDDGQLDLAAEFQRNSVWPRAAKAYLIDTIIANRPIPQLFMQRHMSAQTGRPTYKVIDGQQRLRAVFEFLDDRYPLGKASGKKLEKRKFSSLSERLREQILNYDFVVEELSGYTDRDIKDLFVRMNKYVVRLSPQELRHAREEGAFYNFVERLGAWDFWRERRVFTATQLARMRSVEFAAELTILLIEGPQDKKEAIDLYYGKYQKSFRDGPEVERNLRSYFNWIEAALPELERSRFRKPVDLYSLVGALSQWRIRAGKVDLDPKVGGEALRDFERKLSLKRVPDMGARYLIAASRQTDNLRPRLTRTEILSEVLNS
ncbi:MAG: DUF262 domain-containing protein [Actinobacteria bacterium]|nr:DUF262 domain-containing protein [Actinomycetota bacterium]